MKKRLYVDMDGTLAIWQEIEYFERLYEEGYYRNLLPQMPVVQSVRELMKENNYEVYILSAYLTDSPYALEEKQAWVDMYLPQIAKENRIFIPYGQDKSAYIEGGVKESDYLLDDYTKNLIDFDRSGGNAIKLLNGINHTRGTWKGASVSISHVELTHRLSIELSKPTKSEYITEYEEARKEYQTVTRKLQEVMLIGSYSQNEPMIIKQQAQVEKSLYQMNVAHDKICLRYNLHDKSEFAKFLEEKYIPHTISAECDHYLSSDEEVEEKEEEYER